MKAQESQMIPPFPLTNPPGPTPLFLDILRDLIERPRIPPTTETGPTCHEHDMTLLYKTITQKTF